ncbi:hypothetical protein [Halocella sp. SP3-1]|uniref:hypothetical protein n=1 Tax=Halocella sp. SP3-1 TaxID=2382161 RepID=UPI000F758597|nr:hypothetical protein [Halocella sp. SP3-1]AZO96164.1 hypothetical protein D7D81_17060 [Halocella sp. SP3-1]
MKTKHTPGPWGIEESYTDGGNYFCTIVAKKNNCTKELGQLADYEVSKQETKANAQLIAAVPELLEFAKAMGEWETELLQTDECWEYEFPMMNKELYDKWAELQEMRNEAIKKVEGDEE